MDVQLPLHCQIRAVKNQLGRVEYNLQKTFAACTQWAAEGDVKSLKVEFSAVGGGHGTAAMQFNQMQAMLDTAMSNSKILMEKNQRLLFENQNLEYRNDKLKHAITVLEDEELSFELDFMLPDEMSDSHLARFNNSNDIIREAQEAQEEIDDDDQPMNQPQNDEKQDD